MSRVDPRAPAFTSGLRVGDHVVRVNGCDVTAANLLDVASLVRYVTMTTASRSCSCSCTAGSLYVKRKCNRSNGGHVAQAYYMFVVEDRWVHAARGLASTELSFHSCNVLRDCHKGVLRANKK